MVQSHVSSTAIVNPPGVTPVLTVKQLWEALRIKSRNPVPFVSAIKACEVISEDENGLVRDVEFQPGLGPIKETEEVVYKAPYRAEFRTKTSQRFIQNIISEGPNGELYLTFTFDFERPDLVEGSKEHLEYVNEFRAMGPAVSQHTVDVARELVRKGEITV